MFMYGCVYYLHSKYKNGSTGTLRHLLSMFSKEMCLIKMHGVLVNDQYNVNLWSMYVEF